MANLQNIPTILSKNENNPEPKKVPASQPTAQPTPAPTAQPTPAPTAQPTPAPAAQPTPAPAAQPIMQSTPQQSSTPTAKPAAQPITQSTPQQSSTLTAKPTALSVAPTLQPAPASVPPRPTAPIPVPTSVPASQPTTQPSSMPAPVPAAQQTTQSTPQQSSTPTLVPAAQQTTQSTQAPPRPITPVPTPAPALTSVPPRPTAPTPLQPSTSVSALPKSVSKDTATTIKEASPKHPVPPPAQQPIKTDTVEKVKKYLAQDKLLADSADKIEIKDIHDAEIILAVDKQLVHIHVSCLLNNICKLGFSTKDLDCKEILNKNDITSIGKLNAHLKFHEESLENGLTMRNTLCDGALSAASYVNSAPFNSQTPDVKQNIIKCVKQLIRGAIEWSQEFFLFNQIFNEKMRKKDIDLATLYLSLVKYEAQIGGDGTPIAVLEKTFKNVKQMINDNTLIYTQITEHLDRVQVPTKIQPTEPKSVKDKEKEKDKEKDKEIMELLKQLKERLNSLTKAKNEFKTIMADLDKRTYYYPDIKDISDKLQRPAVTHTSTGERTTEVPSVSGPIKSNAPTKKPRKKFLGIF